MKFTPKTENEIQAMNLVEEGIYEFEVIEAIEGLSQTSGKPRIALKLKIWDKNGNEKIIRDWLSEGLLYKLRHFCETTNILDLYDSGDLNDLHCVGRTGKLELAIQPGKLKPDGGFYPNSNNVKDYVTEESLKNKIENPKNKDEDFLNDDLPF